MQANFGGGRRTAKGVAARGKVAAGDTGIFHLQRRKNVFAQISFVCRAANSFNDAGEQKVSRVAISGFLAGRKEWFHSA